MGARSENSFLFSPLGRKYLMAVTGIYLVVFLLAHLSGNLTLLVGTDGRAFNLYAEFMATNPFIRVMSILGFALIALHVVDGIGLWLSNGKARNVRYAVRAGSRNSTFTSRNMAYLGLAILAFLILHLKGFWAVYKFGTVPMTTIDGEQIANRFLVVKDAFTQLPVVVVYLFAQLVLALHLKHGFYSMFQSLGLHHPKYTPAIKKAALGYAILVPLAFAVIPVVMFIWHR